jgi:hypothetical protein
MIVIVLEKDTVFSDMYKHAREYFGEDVDFDYRDLDNWKYYDQEVVLENILQNDNVIVSTGNILTLYELRVMRRKGKVDEMIFVTPHGAHIIDKNGRYTGTAPLPDCEKRLSCLLSLLIS